MARVCEQLMEAQCMLRDKDEELAQAREELGRKDELLRQTRSEWQGKETKALRRELQRCEGMLVVQQEQTAEVVQMKREGESAREAAAAKVKSKLRACVSDGGAEGQGKGGGAAARVQHLHGAVGDNGLEPVRTLLLLRQRLGLLLVLHLPEARCWHGTAVPCVTGAGCLPACDHVGEYARLCLENGGEEADGVWQACLKPSPFQRVLPSIESRGILWMIASISVVEFWQPPWVVAVDSTARMWRQLATTWRRRAAGGGGVGGGKAIALTLTHQPQVAAKTAIAADVLEGRASISASGLDCVVVIQSPHLAAGAAHTRSWLGCLTTGLVDPLCMCLSWPGWITHYVKPGTLWATFLLAVLRCRPAYMMRTTHTGACGPCRVRAQIASRSFIE